MTNHQTQPVEPAPRRRIAPLAAAAAAAVAGLVLGFGGVASAQTTEPAPSPSTPAPSAPDDRECEELRRGPAPSTGTADPAAGVAAV